MNKSKTNLSLSDRSKWVGIIGSRNATQAENKAAYKFAQNLANLGYIIVSGLAKGIDQSAHEGAVSLGLSVAIVNTTKEQHIYPKECYSTAGKIRQNGCIIHPYSSKAIESNAKGLSHFSKRLIERDMILAWCCERIVAVSDNLTIDGGTRYALNYGKEFGKEIFRLDSNMTLHKNPDFKHGKIWWEPEIDMSKLEEWINQN